MFGSSKFSSAGSIDEYTASIHGVTLQPKIIVLRSVFGLGNLVCQPKKDRITGQYKGVRKLSQEEVKNCSYWVDPDSSVKPVMRTITNNTTFDLSQIVDAIDWLWLQHCDGIALSEEEARKSDNVYFYVYDANRQAEISLKLADANRKALNIIAEIPDERLHNLVRLMNERMEGMPANAVRDYLNRLALDKDIKKVQQVIKAHEDQDAAERLMLYQLIDKGIITIINNIYKFEDFNIGIGEEQVIVFLKDPSKQDVVTKMKVRLYPELVNDKMFSDSIFKK
jgi:hypothetical protein